ncbi:MAG: heme o synthase [Nitrososphaera sp.]|nr:heme o synthase [Nitrososphaera sp.]
MMQAYYSLTKPGMVYGNAVIMLGGFLLASKGHVDLWLLIATLVGLSLVIAAGCVLNNYLERDIDARMARTRDRTLVQGLIPARNAVVFSAVLGLLGTTILFIYTNVLALAVTAFGFVAYIFLYTLWAKRRTVHSTLVGSLAGATPPVIGYTTVSGHFDLAAALLFLILVLWQMPHFFAIGIRRLDDYRTASIPIMPVVYGIPVTKILMLVYIVFFGVAATLLAVLGYVGHVYLTVMTVLSAAWFGFGIKGFWAIDDQKWAKMMFILSLVIILSFSVLIAANVR